MNTKLIPTEKYLLLVDTEAEIKEGDRYLTKSLEDEEELLYNPYIHTAVLLEGLRIYTKAPYECINGNGHKYMNYAYTDKWRSSKIVAHLPLNQAPVLEGVPLLPPLPKQIGHWIKVTERLPVKEGVYQVKRIYTDDIESAQYTTLGFNNYQGYKVEEWFEVSAQEEDVAQLANDYVSNCEYLTKLGSEEAIKYILETHKKSFKAGYKAAAQEKKWSDEDVKKAYKQGTKDGRFHTSNETDEEYVGQNAEAYLQSLSPAPFPTDFIPEYKFLDDDLFPGDSTKVLKIINNTLQGTYLWT